MAKSNISQIDGFTLGVNVENEAIILSTVLKNKEALDKFVKKVHHNDFRNEFHRNLALSIVKMYEDKHEDFSPELIKSKSRTNRISNKVLETSDIEELMKLKEVNVSELDTLISQLKTDKIKSDITDRIFSSLYHECTQSGSNLSDIEKKVEELQKIIKTGYSSSEREFKSMKETIEEYEISRNSKTFYTTGFMQLDSLLNEGLMPGTVCTIAGLPGMGKSSFTLSLMKNLSYKRIPTAQFALEMNNMSIMTKLLAFNSQIPVTKLTKDIQKLSEFHEKILEYEKKRLEKNRYLWLNDKPNQSLKTIREQILVMQDHLYKEDLSNDGYMVIPIDLFGKIRDFASSDNFARDYENKLNEVQVMVRDLGVNFILVAQIHRDAAKGALKRPKMSNLKNAGAFEEVSDLMLGVHRPYYDPDKALKEELDRFALYEDDSDELEHDMESNLAEIIIMKQRMGQNNRIVRFYFDPFTTRFHPWDDAEQQELQKYGVMPEESYEVDF